METGTVLYSERADLLRRVLVVLATVAGAGAGGIILSSQEVVDFLREGPVRVIDLHGDALRIVLGAGTLSATAIAALALWPGLRIERLFLGAVSLGAGLFLIHALLMPAVVLFALAVIVDRAGRVSRDRATQLDPRHHPIPWALGGLGVAAGVAALAWLSVWLAAPLFDEGTMLDEPLAFEVEGLETSPASAAAPTVATDDPELVEASEPAEDPQSVDPAQTATAEDTGSEAAEAGSGRLIAQGELMGIDAFHTGSGAVQLIEAPDGDVILRFQDYAVRNGPDLHVYLTPDPDGDVHAEGAIDLGGIKATMGSVNYEVPAGAEVSGFRSAVIYCQPFSVTFATARLE